MTETLLLQPPRRYPSLDLLRVIAIIMTMMVHTPTLVLRIPGLARMQGGLWLGVDLFMLVSGWLLGGQLLREAARGVSDPLRFYAKRWMRTLPPYYAMLIVLQLLGAKMSWSTWLEHALFVQMYLHNNYYLVSWSLCVEEHFYLLLPLLIALLVRRPRLTTLLGIVVSVEAIAVVCRAVTYSAVAGVPCLTHLRWHGLFVGMAFAWLQQNRPAAWKSIGRFVIWLAPIGVVATCVVMLSIPAGPSRWTSIGAPTVGTWALALAFLPCVHEASPLSRISFRGLEYLGGLTYAIYLTHDVLPRALVNAGGVAGSLRGASWRIGIVIVAALVLHHVVERPALRLREHLLARWHPAPSKESKGPAKSESEAA